MYRYMTLTVHGSVYYRDVKEVYRYTQYRTVINNIILSVPSLPPPFLPLPNLSQEDDATGTTCATKSPPEAPTPDVGVTGASKCKQREKSST